MKKILILLLCFNFAFAPAFCAVNAKITDDFVQNSLDKNLTPKTRTIPVIVDEFAQNNTNKSNHFKPKVNFEVNKKF